MAFYREGMGDPARKSIARSLGEFVGHIWHGATSKPEGGVRREEIRREVEEEVRETASGEKVIARRTTIEEIEYRPDHPRRSD